MSKKIRIADLPEFDPAEHLHDDADIAAYLTLVVEQGDPAELAHALGVVARARGMTEIAKAAGMTREGLYKALRGDAQPRYETVARVLRAFGLQLTTKTLAA
jgi:probable addiction module antidote protein